MKTKTLFMLSLLFSIALTQLPAQTINHAYSVETQSASEFPVYCDGVLSETLAGTLNEHIVIRVKNGVREFLMCQYKGEYTSKTGEVFQSHEEGIWIREGNIYSCHGVLIGDKGSRYITFIKIYISPWKLIIEKAVCPGNGIEVH